MRWLLKSTAWTKPWSVSPQCKEVDMPFDNPLDHLVWAGDGVAWRDKAPDHSNAKRHKANAFERRRKAAKAAKKARRRNRK